VLSEAFWLNALLLALPFAITLVAVVIILRRMHRGSLDRGSP
jgi:hypothetical protein